jgi:hypothetical protein
MSREVTVDDLTRWQQFVQAEAAATAARTALFANRGALVDLVRSGLDKPAERAAALDVASRLKTEEVKELFPDLLALASYGHGLTRRCQELILGLPRPWLLAHVERHAEPILSNAGDEEYRAFLGLYAQLDRGLATRLAQRAIQSDDVEIREAGEDYLRQPQDSSS